MRPEQLDSEFILELAMSCGYRISEDPLKRACIELMLCKFAYTIARQITEPEDWEQCSECMRDRRRSENEIDNHQTL